jgi:hypothetical protein
MRGGAKSPMYAFNAAGLPAAAEEAGRAAAAKNTPLRLISTVLAPPNPSLGYHQNAVTKARLGRKIRQRC